MEIAARTDALRAWAEARAAWTPVWVVVDGSTDGTAEGLQRLVNNQAHCE